VRSVHAFVDLDLRNTAAGNPLSAETVIFLVRRCFKDCEHHSIQGKRELLFWEGRGATSFGGSKPLLTSRSTSPGREKVKRNGKGGCLVALFQVAHWDVRGICFVFRGGIRKEKKGGRCGRGNL